MTRLAFTWWRTVQLAVSALSSWTARQACIAAGAAVVFGSVLGVVTVLVPNPFFTRDIAPEWWNYPVWVLTSVFSGMLVATYVRRPSGATPDAGEADSGERDDLRTDAWERRTSRLGIAGAMLAWFAVGCPVCNKLALLALGYSGAITWFAPMQPFLAVGALILTATALIWRLRGQVSCPVPARQSGERFR